jgi:pilus assembly protein CpaC
MLWLSIVVAALAAASSFAQDEAEPAASPSPSSPSVVSRVSEKAAERHRIRLTTGENRTVDIAFDLSRPEQITIGNPQIVSTTVARVQEQRQLVFNPLKQGETTVTLRDPEGKIRVIYDVSVTGSDLLRRKEELSLLLRDIEGIDLKIVGQKIVIDGELLVPQDYARLLGVIQDESYAKLVLNLATISPLAMQMLSKKIEQDIHQFAPDVYTRVVNGMVFLEGSVDNGDKMKRAVEVAKLYLPDVIPGNPLAVRGGDSVKRLERSPIQNFIVVNAPQPRKQEKLVRVTIHFVKLSKDYGRYFGFKWQPGLTSSQASIAVGADPNGGLGANGSSLTATISNLFPKLQTAQQAGFARVLKSQTIIVRSGQPATVSEKSSIPFIMQNSEGQPTSSSVDTGIEFNVTPQIIGQSDDISLDLNLSQVSEDGAPPPGGAPTTTKHEVKTKIYVKSAESAAVAGVTSDDTSTAFNKDPDGTFQGGTDTLFNLKRSKNYQKNKSQYVVFVTPQIIESASTGTDDLKKSFRMKVK